MGRNMCIHCIFHLRRRGRKIILNFPTENIIDILYTFNLLITPFPVRLNPVVPSDRPHPVNSFRLRSRFALAKTKTHLSCRSSTRISTYDLQHPPRCGSMHLPFNDSDAYICVIPLRHKGDFVRTLRFDPYIITQSRNKWPEPSLPVELPHKLPQLYRRRLIDRSLITMGEYNLGQRVK